MKFESILFFLWIPLLAACGKSFDEDAELIALERNETVLARVASNIGFFRDLADAAARGDVIAAMSAGKGCWDIYWDNGAHSVVFPDPSVEDVVPPAVSALMKDGSLCWAVNGTPLSGKDKRSFPVTGTQVPELSVSGPEWVLSIGAERFAYTEKECTLTTCVRVENGSMAVFQLPSGDVFPMQKADRYAGLLTRDANRAFYKDVFLDAGVGLTTRTKLPAATYLGISIEGLTGRLESDKEWQRTLLAGGADDTNGRLLYPDGQPRYRVLFVNGGSSTSHGKAMGEVVRSRMRTFFEHGGSYVGTCAGGFFASSGNEYYLHIWPGVATHTGISGDYTDFVIETGSPLMDYYDFGGDGRIEQVRQNGGGYASSLPAGTEILARYVYPSIKSVDNQPSVWAYKASSESGRAVLTGGHPEEVTSGERRDLAAAMVLYAMEGQGTTPLKSILRNGQVKSMKEADERIGDLQCHHFAFWLPEAAGTVDVSLVGEATGAWALSLSQEGFAYPDQAPFVSESESLSADLEPGLWYLSVRCLTTVDVTDTEVCQEYSGRTDVLNGIPYSICVRWEES